MGAHPSSRAAAAVAGAALLVCAGPTQVEAASAAQAVSSQVGASSGGWGAVATTATAAPYSAGAALVLPFPNAGTNGQPSYPPQFFTVGNTGTLNISAANYAITGTPTTTTFTVESCNAGWNEAANTCPGSISSVVTTLTSPQSSTVVPGGGGQGIRLRASVTGTIPKNTVPALTIGISVTRAQVRASTTTGS